MHRCSMCGGLYVAVDLAKHCHRCAEQTKAATTQYESVCESCGAGGEDQGVQLRDCDHELCENCCDECSVCAKEAKQ